MKNKKTYKLHIIPYYTVTGTIIGLVKWRFTDGYFTRSKPFHETFCTQRYRSGISPY